MPGAPRPLHLTTGRADSLSNVAKRVVGAGTVSVGKDLIPVEGDYKVTWSGPNRTGIPIAWAGMFLPTNGVVIEPDALAHVLTLEDGRKGIILFLAEAQRAPFTSAVTAARPVGTTLPPSHEMQREKTT